LELDVCFHADALYLAPGAGLTITVDVDDGVTGKIQLYFGELNTMRWIRKATTTPVRQYAARTARKL